MVLVRAILVDGNDVVVLEKDLEIYFNFVVYFSIAVELDFAIIILHIVQIFKAN